MPLGKYLSLYSTRHSFICCRVALSLWGRVGVSRIFGLVGNFPTSSHISDVRLEGN